VRLGLGQGHRALLLGAIDVGEVNLAAALLVLLGLIEVELHFLLSSVGVFSFFLLFFDQRWDG